MFTRKKIILFSLFIAATIFIFQIDRIGEINPEMAGVRLMVVVSGSMNPAFDTGALVAAREVDPKMLAVGDIITFRDSTSQDRLITHRIVGIEEENGIKMFTTQGDANDARDFDPVPEGNVVGKIFFDIPYAGFIVYFIQRKVGLLLLLVPIIFLAGEIYFSLRSRKRTRAIS
ncbi:MAG: signal peptidase I [Desulfitobacteriaceae bacterium]|nr:signal peptidase I [Desulfitobacteriaceae bacterium]